MAIGGATGGDGNMPKKKQRVGSNSQLSSTRAVINSSFSDETLTESSHKSSTLHRSSSVHGGSSGGGGFNDSDTADVILRLHLDHRRSPFDSFGTSSDSVSFDVSDVQIYLHSHIIRRAKYFSALLSDRWQRHNDDNSPQIHRLSLGIPPTPDSINDYLEVLRLLYSDDLSTSINSVVTALALLPISLELLFEDCIKACVKFLEAVPWSEDEERKILNLIPFLSNEESKEILTRVSPLKNDSSEEMLHGLILSAIHNHPNMAFAKAFVAKLLRDFSSKESVRRVLDKVFEKSLKVVKESLEEYSSPNFRGDHNETEAIQRLNLHSAMTNGKHLLWLVERMIELRVADTAVKSWSEQASFTADLQRAFRDDAWRNITPSLPAVVLRCTSRLANAVATGNILAARQVRMKLVKDWLPVLIVCKDNMSPMCTNHKSLCLELEETFLRIISTLPVEDSQELLQQCLSFSTRNVEDCPHLVTAFTTWFRRANRSPPADDFHQ